MKTNLRATRLLMIALLGLLAACSSVRILQPATGATFQAGDTVEFEGQVTRSAETGGADRSDDLEWASSVDGDLGTGRTVTSSSLGVGTHTVTATWPSRNRTARIQIEILP